MVSGVDPHGEAMVWCRKVFGRCAVPSEAEADEPLQARKGRHERARINVEHIPQARRGEGAREERERMESRRRKKKSHKERVQEAKGGMCCWRFHGTKKASRTLPKTECRKTEERLPIEECDLMGEYKAPHKENFLSSWLREDTEGKAEERRKLARKPKNKNITVEERKGRLWCASVLAMIFLLV